MKLKAHAGTSPLTLCLAALVLSTAAAAQERGCIELKTTAETQEEYRDEHGRSAHRLVPAGKVVPGHEVVWTITASNVCAKAVENVVIANPVPEHMRYVADSAMGTGTSIAYSLDGKQFADESALVVRADDGSSRPARADEYRAIRWTFTAPFAPGSTAFVRYRAVVK